MERAFHPISSAPVPSVSVIVPVSDGGDKFRRCLMSLVNAEPMPDEIIVVADGATDDSLQSAEEFGAHIVKIPESAGPARARNLGAHRAVGDILFFVDADVTVPEDAVRKVVRAFQQQPDVAAVFGSYDDEPFENNFLSQYKNLLHHYVHQTANTEASTFWGACGAVRRDIFLSLGGFKERYRRPCIEDVELGYRLRRAGHRIRLVKSLRVKHLKHWGVSSLLKTDFFHRALPWTELICEEGRLLNDLNISLVNRISVVLAWVLFLALAGIPFIPKLGIPAVVAAVCLLFINWDTYRFFAVKRGLGFALLSIPWHWFYFLYSGLAFAMGAVRFRMKRAGKDTKNLINAGKTD